jgi:hypothetical protein
MSTQPHLLTLRSNTKYNSRLSVPPDYVRAHGLPPGARVLWLPQPDGVLLKFNPDFLSVLQPVPPAPCDGPPT